MNTETIKRLIKSLVVSRDRNRRWAREGGKYTNLYTNRADRETREITGWRRTLRNWETAQ